MNTLSRFLSLLLLFSPLALPAHGLAQDGFRVDVMVPRLGGGFVLRTSGRDDPFVEGDLEVRAVHTSGHGLSIRGGIALGDTDFYPMLDADYLYRGQLLGDARLGLALDVMAGLSGGAASDCVGAIGCTNRPAIDGGRMGGNVGGSLIFQAYGFALDVDVRYRLLLPTDAAGADELWEPEHVLVVTAGIGFGFF